MGSFVFTDHQQQQQPGLQVPPECSADKNGLNAMLFLGQIHTSPLLSRPMGPIGHAHPIHLPSEGGFRWIQCCATDGFDGTTPRVELPLDRRAAWFSSPSRSVRRSRSQSISAPASRSSGNGSSGYLSLSIWRTCAFR
ncbi:uncharacterized protein LOC117194689 isoform X2 [Drosophila miranda]|uniref:uncharacterized protein LOC117194689 isoform X2 n=1 Tax=Drosophila miranda TaxID=7229 RepID=UPI00143F8A55|nr:uncharacterized protein LOC117194689 isoform X2 [Drosophila miranda]